MFCGGANTPKSRFALRREVRLTFKLTCPNCEQPVQILNEWVGKDTAIYEGSLQVQWIKFSEVNATACKLFSCVGCGVQVRVVNSENYCKFCPQRVSCLSSPIIETNSLQNFYLSTSDSPTFKAEPEWSTAEYFNSINN
jgi:hypothetical protein